MTFSEAIKNGMANFFNPVGRLSRSGFWWYALCIFVVSGVLGVIGGFVSGHGGMEQTWVGIIFDVLGLVLFISLFIAEIRRLHDSGKSGWNILWQLIPVIGLIYEIILLCRESEPGPNKYGVTVN